MTMRRGDEIEVYSRDDFRKGSWLRAILEEDALPQSVNKKLNVTLLANDGSSTQKTTYRWFIRPVPPESKFTAVEFEEGSVVGASQRDGWWTGLVVKKINHENVWVYFDSPPDLFQFNTSQLRQHFVWKRQKWVRPRNRVVSKKSTFRCGTMVEVKVMDVWVPSVIVKELENGENFIVKPFKNLSRNDGEAPKPNMTVDSGSVRLTPAPVSVERYEVLEFVEVFLEPGWRSGMVMRILCDERYYVFLKATNQSLVFKNSAIRRSGESITKLFLQNTNEVNGEKEVPEDHSREDDTRKRKRGEVEHNLDLFETAANELVSPLGLSQAIIPLKQAETVTQEMVLQPVSNQSGVENHTAQENESSKEGKRQRELIRGVEETQSEDSIVVLPFAKKSHLWKELETMEVFQRAPPQTPHFRTLVGESEVFWEGHALGMLLTFSKLLESFKDLEPDVPMSQLDNFKVSFAKLEDHGFNVSAPLAQINKLLALKEKQLKAMEEQNGLDREVMALKEEFGEMQHKLIELERQQVALRAQSETVYHNISKMESCARDRGLVLDNLESEFKATSSAPW